MPVSIKENANRLLNELAKPGSVHLYEALVELQDMLNALESQISATTVDAIPPDTDGVIAFSE